MIWQTAFGKCIYQSSSGVRVYDNGFYRWLKVDSGSLQTVLNKVKPHRPVLHYLHPFLMMAQHTPGDCCVLGLGGAGALHALSPFLHTHSMTAVELNAEVIAVARKYFKTSQLDKLTLIHDEASHFVGNSQKQFKHLLIDIACKDQFPQQCQNEAFFRQCKRLLVEEGFLAVNFLAASEQQALYTLIAHVFDNQLVTFPVKKSSNLVVIACRSKKPNALLDILRSNYRIKTLQWDSQWGYLADFFTA